MSVYLTGDNNGQIGNLDGSTTRPAAATPSCLEVYARGLREFASLLSEGEAGEDREQVASSLEREAAKPEPDHGWASALIDRARGLLGATKELKNLVQATQPTLEVYNTAPGG